MEKPKYVSKEYQEQLDELATNLMADRLGKVVVREVVEQQVMDFGWDSEGRYLEDER